MSALSAFLSDYDSYYDLYALKTNTNQRQAEDREQELRKLHGLMDLFTLAGRTEDHTSALTYYQAMLTLLEVPATDPEWNVTIADLQSFFGNNQAFQTATFANPLTIDVTTYKNWKCAVTGDTVIYLANAENGDNGQIVLVISGVGGYTISLDSSSFEVEYGGGTIGTVTGDYNIISWLYDGDVVHYIINTKSLS